MKDWTFETSRQLKIDVRIPAGTVEIRTETTTQTRVEVTSGVADDLRVELRPGGSSDRLEIHGDHRRKPFGWRDDPRLHIVVVAPEGSDVSFTSGSADLLCAGPIGSIVFRSGSGDLAFEEALGAVTIKVGGGQVQGGRVNGGVRVHSASGDVRMGDVAGSFVGRSVSGDLMTGAVEGAIQASSVSGRVDIGSVQADVTVRSVSGDVEIGVAHGTRVWLDVRSTSGETVSELDAAAGDGPASELSVTTVSGDIRLHREREPRRVDA